MAKLSTKERQELRDATGMTLDRLSRLDTAWVLNIAGETLSRWKECPKNQDGTFNLQRVVQWRIDSLIETTLTGEELERSESLDRLRLANAKRAELELSARRGELVDRAAMEAAWLQTLTRLRQMLLGLPNGLATRLEGRTAREASAVLDARLREMLEEFQKCPG